MTLPLARTALYSGVGDLLVAQTSNFHDRVFSRFHPFSTNPDDQDFPYVVMVIVGGGNANRRKHRDAEFQLQVACYADSADDSEAGALVIDNALDDNELKQLSDQINAGDWIITSVTATTVITRVEYYENARTVFVDGKVYRVTMEVT